MSIDLTFDKNHLWHPYTGMNTPDLVHGVVGAKGCLLEMDNGQHLVDGMSSWWTAIHGYNHPALNAAVTQQLERCAHVMFGGLTHGPAVELGKLLVDLTPAQLQHVFLADSGSVSVEVALKQAVQYQRAQGQPKRCKFMALRGGYHGDTLGAMSVCDPDGSMHSHLKGYLPEHLFAPRPAAKPGQAIAPEELAAYDRLFENHAHEMAGFILEPLVQGAGGMWFYDAAYLRHFRQLCDQHGVLLIFDEIATGFGRTGKWFAAGHAGVSPDIMTVGKALTGGYMTLAACLCTSAVAQAISAGSPGVLMHGPTFMANPLACAVAVSSLTLLKQAHWPAQVARIESTLITGLAPLQSHPKVADVRIFGGIGVVELKAPANVQAAQQAAMESGVWLRPFGKLVYVMPPYIMQPAELSQLIQGVQAAVEAA